jgi:hypothetical protein
MKCYDAVGENYLGFPRYAEVVYCDICDREIDESETYHFKSFTDCSIRVSHVCNDCHNLSIKNLTGTAN